MNHGSWFMWIIPKKLMGLVFSKPMACALIAQPACSTAHTLFLCYAAIMHGHLSACALAEAGAVPD